MDAPVQGILSVSRVDLICAFPRTLLVNISNQSADISWLRYAHCWLPRMREIMRVFQGLLGSVAFLSAMQACNRSESAQAAAEAAKPALVKGTIAAAARSESNQMAATAQLASNTYTPKRASADTALFAGGCFWSMERPFQHVPGVIGTTVGYAGGHTKNPTYEQVNTKTTGHTETVQVEFDPSKVTYEKLLDIYWHNIDPVTKDRQFCDGGPDYRTAIFTRNARQSSAATASKKTLDASGHFKTPIVTEIAGNTTFWRGEEYHQHFADRNPGRYDAYRRGCGRDARLHELWGDAASPYVPKS